MLKGIVGRVSYSQSPEGGQIQMDQAKVPNRHMYYEQEKIPSEMELGTPPSKLTFTGITDALQDCVPQRLKLYPFV